MNTKYLFGMMALFVLCTACKPGIKENKNDSSDQVRKLYLENLKTNYITPELAKLKKETTDLATAADTLYNNLNLSNLEKLQRAYTRSYSQYLKLDAFRFGAFKEESIDYTLFSYIAAFPCNTVLLENKISSNSFNAEDFNNTTRGFTTLDYLLHDFGGQQDAVLEKLKSSNRANYLKKNCRYIDSMVAITQNKWNVLSITFAESSSTEPGSNLSELFNTYLESFETAKNYKLQIPGGFNANNLGELFPEKVEAYYSGMSKKYLKEHVQSLYDVWKGNTNSSSNIGFDDIVIAQTGDSSFVNNVFKSFEEVIMAIDALPNDRIDKMIVDNNLEVKNVYDKMATLTRFIKSDMVSKFGFSVTYSSNDGD